MSTIFGMLSLKQKIETDLFLKMKDAFKDDRYDIYKNNHMIVATTQSISEDGKYAFCGRVRNLIELQKESQLQNADIFKIYELYQTVDVFDGHFVFLENKDDHFILYKDALGIEPLYYYICDDVLYFASEIKGLLGLKEEWTITKDGILQVLGLLPALDIKETPYHGIYHLHPGGRITLKQDEITIDTWWKIHTFKNTKSKEEILKDISHLVETAVHQDMENHTACMLSGGLDSSVITSIVCESQTPNTYDVIYEGNEKYFKAYDYQTTLDKPFINAMKHRYQLHHQTVVLSQEDLSHTLDEVLFLRDLPGMVDIDSSLLLFCLEIAKKENFILSGECADEFFGGYPWFYKSELNQSPYFPWTRHIEERNQLFLDQFNISDYIIQKRKETTRDLNLSLKNEIMYLTMQWFMQTLVIRGDVIGRACDLDIRMPFASKPLFEYLWNVDWNIFYEEGKEKVLLREAFKDILPEEIYSRKKNPFPKTHSPVYTNNVVKLLKKALTDDESILFQLFKKEKLEELLETKGESFQHPWYGQLMTGPQLIAFIYTIHQWGKLYPITLKI